MMHNDVLADKLKAVRRACRVAEGLDLSVPTKEQPTSVLD